MLSTSNNTINLVDFLNKIRERLGREAVASEVEQIDPYRSNVTGFTRSIEAVVYAKSTEEVQVIVEFANNFKVHLYPISKGKNWGMGSKLPVSDNCVILDLSRMNHIHEVSSEFGYAIIEPGVSQQQLAEYLEQNTIPYIIDVTGSGQDTSIVGNTVERGVAYNSMRTESYLSMEVVTGSGEVVQMGFSHYQNAKAKNLYKYGIGPDLSGLFFQSNFGVVTKLTIKLYPIPECREAFLFTVKDEDLFDFVGVIKRLKSFNLFQSIIHIANRRRSEISIAPLIKKFCKENDISLSEEEFQSILSTEIKGPWSAVGCLSGTKRQVAAAKYELKKHLADIGKARFFQINKIDKLIWWLKFLNIRKKYIFMSAVKPILGLTSGKPTNTTLHSVVWPNGEEFPKDCHDPDLSQSGLIYCLPILPIQATSIAECLGIIDEISQRHGFVPAITLNVLNDCVIETVISIDFNKRDAEGVKRAHLHINQLIAVLIKAGYYPYRVDVDNMKQIYQKDEYWNIVSKLKELFDPNKVIAPKRYEQEFSS